MRWRSGHFEDLDRRFLSVAADTAVVAIDQRQTDVERIAVMTALNLSDELLKLQKNEKHRQENVDSRIRMLVDELDDALDEHLS